MSSTVLTSRIDITLPEWLQQCLDGSSTLSAQAEDDRRHNETSLILRAFEFAYQLHQGQYRKSGEPYISHPVAVLRYTQRSRW